MVTIEKIPPRFSSELTVSEKSLLEATISTEKPMTIDVIPSTKEKPLENTPIKTATTEDKSMIGTIGVLAKAPQRIITNGSNINIFQVKIELSSVVNPPTLSPEVLSCSKPRPTTNQTIIPTKMAAIVVHDISFILT